MLNLPPSTPKRPVLSRSPESYWFRTENGLWASRAWYKGERAEYCRTALYREPMAGES